MIIRSFKDVIADKYYDFFFKLLTDYVQENPNAIDSRSHIVDAPDQAELLDFSIKYVDITKCGDNNIHFNVVVSAEIEISEHRRHSDRESDSCEQWYRFVCSATLENGIRNFAVSDIGTYNGKQRYGKDGLSEYLVPFIRTVQLEAEAEKFLERYYPEALQTPMPVSPYILADRMSLEIKSVSLTKNLSIFGQIYFSDGEVQCYDGEARSFKALAVKRGTILVDPTVYFLRTVGSVNNTIVHECVHWDKHRMFFELEHLYNKDAHSISCKVNEGTKQDDKRSPLDWMEWQANALAPRILMPAAPTRAKIDELIATAKQNLQTEKTSEIVESVVLALSDFFVVSKVAAKIRMIDLGYPEAAGVCNYVDGHYVSSYSFEKDALKKGQTFTIGAQDALAEYAMNPDFRKTVDSGNYIYVDGHYCINSPIYVSSNEDGDVLLTDYGRQHIDECCLVFDLRIKNVQKGTAYYTECVLYRNAASDTVIETGYTHSTQNQVVLTKAVELKKVSADLAKIMGTLPASFSGTLKAHMSRGKCTVESLAEKSLVSAKTIQRMRNEDNHATSLQTVVAVCIGLQLHPLLSKDIVEKAGFRFRPAHEEHIIYQLLLGSYNHCSIYECNELLVSNGFKALGRED